MIVSLIQVWAARRCGGAAAHHGFESGVAANLETAAAERAAQPARHVQVVERNDAAAHRIDPEQLGVRRRSAIGKMPAA